MTVGSEEILFRSYESRAQGHMEPKEISYRMFQLFEHVQREILRPVIFSGKWKRES